MKLSLSACLLGKHNEELNIAICEWLGFKTIQNPNGSWCSILLIEGEDGSVQEHVTSDLPSHILGIEALGNIQIAILSQDREFISDFNTRLLDFAITNQKLVCELTALEWSVIVLVRLGTIA
jgi:hypothetical protein